MYTQADYDMAKKQTFTRAGAALALAIVMLAGFIVLNRLRLQYAEMALAALSFCAIYFLWSFKVSPWVKYLKFLRDMRNGQRRTTECSFVSASPETRLHDGVEVHEYIMTVGTEEEDERLFYWDADKPQPKLNAGDRARIVSFGNFVVEFYAL